MKYLLLLVLIIAVSCNEDEEPSPNEPGVSISQSQIPIDGTFEPRGSDPFRINSVEVENQNLLVEVSYGGGCKVHDFELIWPGVITLIFPPDFGVVLTHDANEDLCEAFLTDTLVFDISDNPLGLSEEAISAMRISVINDSDNSNVVSNR
ncbi:MAG: hypothetical protein AAF363_02495 [Bacteroidota bacterium]